jgi:hypothetical protein
MAQLIQRSITVPRARVRPIGGAGFDWLIVALSGWLLGGLYLDGWAHTHDVGVETFFSTWHGVLYSGYLTAAIALLAATARNVTLGYTWREAVPAGYSLALLGAGLFALGGLGDMGWHLAFGIETGIEPLLSPTHLLLALGGFLIAGGPLRAAWLRPDHPRSWAALLPVVLALAFVLSLFTFFTDYLHPFANTWEAGPYRPGLGDAYARQAAGMGSIFVQAGILMGFVLLALRRWRLPPGSMTLILGLNMGLMVAMHDIFIDTGPLPMLAAAVGAGLAADALLWALRPAPDRRGAWRVFAFAVPAILYTLYYAALALYGGGTWWAIHAWTGAIILAGVTGLLVSFLVLPPAMPSEEQAAGTN